MPFGSQHEQAACIENKLFRGVDFRLNLRSAFFPFGVVFNAFQFLRNAQFEIAAQLNVRSAARHIRGDGNRTRDTCVTDDKSFALMLTRVQNFVLNTVLFQMARQLLRLLDGNRTDQHRLLFLIALDDLSQHGIVTLGRRTVHFIIVVDAHHWLVGRYVDHFQTIDFRELPSFGHCCPGHTGQFRIHTEVILERDGGQGLVLHLDRHLFFCLKRLMQTFGIPTAFHHATGELIDNDDFVFLNDVVLVTGKQFMGAQRLVHVMYDGDVLNIV